MIVIAALALGLPQALGTYMDTIDGWELRRDPSGKCSLDRTLENGVIAAIITDSPDKGRLILANSAWSSLLDKPRVTVQFTTHGTTADLVAFTGSVEDMPLIAIPFNPSQYLYTFASINSEDTVSIKANGIELAHIKAGALDAADALIKCASGGTDPFKDK